MTIQEQLGVSEDTWTLLVLGYTVFAFAFAILVVKIKAHYASRIRCPVCKSRWMRCVAAGGVYPGGWPWADYRCRCGHEEKR